MSNKDTRTRVASAFRAMKAIGICEDKVKPVLKSLLKLYDKNWELIEVENYRALADAIFEREELEAAEHSKKINTQTEDHLEEETHAAEESVRPLKRLRLRHRDGQTSTVNSSDQGTIRTPLIRPKDEPVDTVDLPINGPAATGKSPQSMEESTTIQSQAATLPSLGRDKGKQHVSADINEGCDPSQTGSMSKNWQKTQLETEPISQSHSMRLRDRRPGVSPQMTSKEKRPVPDSSDHALCLKEPKDEPENVPTLDKKSTSKQALIKVKDEPITDDMPCLEAPVVGHTETSKRGDSLSRRGMLRQNNSPESSALQCLSDKETANGTNTVNQPTNNGNLSLTSVVCSPNVEIASSHSGDARIDLNCHLTSGRSDFTVPSLEAVLKCVEDKCFKPLDPNISLMSIMKEICQCFLDLGTNSSSQSTIVGISPNTNLSKCSASDGQGGAGNMCTSSLNGLVNSQTGSKLPESHTLVLPCDRMNNGVQPNINAEDNIMTNRETEENCAKKTNGVSLEFGQQPPETPSNKVDDGEQQTKMDTGDKVDDEGLLKQVDAGDNMDDGEQQKKMDDGEQQKKMDDGEQQKKMDAGEQQKLMDDGEHQKQMDDDGEQQKHMDDGEQQKQMDDGEQQNKMNAGGKVDDGEQQKQMDAGDNMDDGEQQNQTDAGDQMDDGEQQNQTDAGGEMVTTSGTQENHVQGTIDQSLDVVQLSQPTPGTIVPFHDVVDIAKGQENVIITLVNEVNDESPPSFYYIPQNAAFQNAYVNFSLARIGDKNCCATCSMDCLSSSIPCACAHESGGEFAYTSDGLVKEELLKESISMNRDPKKHSQYFCKECPLERSKCGDIIEPCKGHLVRKFIKECWWKCGCSMQCGNRVVQRGISRKLQVFMAPGGKGWGLRTLEDLPKGAFVCEYVGEVLTNAELFERVLKSPQGEKHSYPVLLDADWCAEAVLKDEEALCLDATYYGNVARFINHRCYDSNLVEIPVEVETPDHHYYHLAFFTSRKVKAMEELTWDYGIDFDDHDHPIKAFRCQCGSKFCRNIKRSRSRSKRW